MLLETFQKNFHNRKEKQAQNIEMFLCAHDFLRYSFYLNSVTFIHYNKNYYEYYASFRICLTTFHKYSACCSRIFPGRYPASYNIS